jgi:hypothetical protein
MKHERPVAPRLVALLAVGAVAFGYPLLALFNVPGTVLGVPVLYAYLFGVWAVLVALIAALVPRRH